MLIRGNLRLKGNFRIDAREELVRKLKLPASSTDEELILSAYEAWGEDCVNYLIGDFAFAIRDDGAQRIFCARDHFGVKPFFYTHSPDRLKFSTNLNELRCDPRVSDTLNEIAVGDYLLFGVNQDLSTTIFKDIRRLPPGHSLTFANNTIKIRRYWTPENVKEVWFRDPGSYVERFSELLSRAVADRLRTERVAISMSGGLDSTSLAAIARELKDNSAVHAFSVVYDSLIPDEERHYSTAAAEHLNIPITHINADRYSLFDGDMDQPEPFLISPLTGQFNELLRLCANFGEVALTGYDGDAFMNEAKASVKSKLKRLLPKRPQKDIILPAWLDESFGQRTHLHDRLKEFGHDPANRSNPVNKHPSALRALSSKMWPALFEGYDRSSTKLPLDVRHPFIDIRLIQFLLAIPPEPWCINKHILRRAMNDKLPRAVLERRKTPLAGDPALQLARRASVRWLDSFEVSPQLGAFINLNRRCSIADEATSDALWASLRVFALNHWLTNSQPIDRVEPRRDPDFNRPDCQKTEMMHGT